MSEADRLLALLGPAASKFEKSAALTIHKVKGVKAALRFIREVKRGAHRQLPMFGSSREGQIPATEKSGKILRMQGR